MDLILGPEYEVFKADVMSFLTVNRGKAPGPGELGFRHKKRHAWQRFLIKEGLAARTIPKEYGGYGGEPDILKSRIIAEAFAEP